ncbi:MAG TPA: fumarylacetoacetate hydrolase family protein [Patescibacteria group bacterium]|nr:fumarylacetoacetate hydrolase family protein [Patescibacteria group bacterium]
MKIIRYRDSGGAIHHAAETAGGKYARIRGDIFGQHEVTGEPAQVARLLAPVEPPMIWCIGLNYRQHMSEVKMAEPKYPVVFAKGPNCLAGPQDAIRIPTHARGVEIDYEAELVIVIGKICRNVSRQEALPFVAGYTCGNDVGARDWQLKLGGGQWCRGKSFDTFAPLGPCLVTAESLPDPGNLRIQTILNGKQMQDGNTRDMIFDVPTLVSFLSESTTLLPGTVIMTGTPAGVGMGRTPPVWLKAGDEVSVTIEGIGTLTNPVRDEP